MNSSRVKQVLASTHVHYYMHRAAGMVVPKGSILVALHEQLDLDDLLDTLVHEAVHLAHPKMREDQVTRTTKALLKKPSVRSLAYKRAAEILWDAYVYLSRDEDS